MKAYQSGTMRTKHWPNLGVKQTYAEVRLLDEDTDERRSTTEACQRLQDEDMTAEQSQRVENALKVAPEAKQFMLGRQRW